MSNVSQIPGEIIVLISIFYLVSFYILIKIKNRQFNSTDPIPTLLPISQINIEDPTKLVKINTGLFIKDFSTFDMIKRSFSMNALVWFEFDRGLININALDQFTFENAAKITQQSRTLTLYGNKLLVQYSINVEFSTNANYEFFPLDDHQLFFTITNDYFSPTEVEFIVKSVNFNYSSDLAIEDWSILGKEASAGYIDVILDESTGKKIQHPRVVYSLKLKRSGLRKTFLIILPILFIFLVSTSTIWPELNPHQESMLSTAIGCLTGVLAYRFVINSMAPNVSYAMLFEYIYNIVLVFIFFNFLLVLNDYLIHIKLPIASLGGYLYVSTRLILFLSVVYLLFFHKQKNKFSFNFFYHTYLKNYKKRKTLLSAQKIDFTKVLRFSEEFIKNNKEKSYLKDKIKKIAYFFKRKDIPFLSSYFLLNVFREYSKTCLLPKNSVIKFPSLNSCQCIIFNTSTDFSILVRHIQQLIDTQFLDNNLTLLNPKQYIIFNGNLAGGASYILETLALVMILKLKNPTQVFLIEGPQERYHNWKTQTLDEINQHFPKKIQIHVLELLTKILDSLPIAIYLPYINNQQYVRISCFNEESSEATITDFDNFLLKPNKSVETLALSSNQLPAESSLNIPFIANICQNQRNNFHNELSLALPHHLAIVWTLPVSNSGAFALLDLNQEKNQYHISLCKSSLPSMKDYQSTTYHLIYGYRIVHTSANQYSISKDFIIGSTMDLTRTSSIVSTRLRYGLYTKMIELNSTGIHDEKIKLKVFNDEYMPLLAKKNVSQLIDILPEKIILSPVGTPTLEAYFPRIQNKELLVLFPISGGSFFRKPEYSHIVAVRASFAEEGQVLLKHAVEVKGVSRIAIFYQNDSYGLGALHGVEPLLKEYQVDWLPVPYQRNNLDPEQAASKIINFNADTIIFFSTAAPSIALVHQLGIQRVADMTLLAISYGCNSFQEYLQSIGISLTRTHVSPDLNSDLEIIKEYHQAREKSLFHFPASDESLEGYINASILSYVLNAITPPFTKEKIIDYITTIKNQNLKGLTLDFNPETREIFHEVWIETR